MTKRTAIIYLTLIFALILTISPMPPSIAIYRPDWVLVALIYWCIALPNRVNVGVAWVCGLFVDLLMGYTLGSHALILALIAYIASANFLRIRNFSVWQQAIIVGMLSLFYHLTDYWVAHFLTDAFFQPELMWSALTSMLVWPWAFALLRKLRRTFKIT
ncbi:rod shape-determining protein MreD [Catenovulum sp. SM1970]|uniref:rod shape-determining protein MreD n=1 Tax=Marinifaba aquimaris TaxID=2741323 RepID=UPI001571FED4|nr:rod shape-determining protein MreD [Marinifaba aquimaris]NTS75874.1 rod shape-determining protein MreD [Marinifaba aquimaris]